MSAYSDWRSGALSDEEYDRECKNEQLNEGFRAARIAALRREGAFLDQHIYGRSTDADYCKED